VGAEVFDAFALPHKVLFTLATEFDIDEFYLPDAATLEKFEVNLDGLATVVFAVFYLNLGRRATASNLADHDHLFDAMKALADVESLVDLFEIAMAFGGARC